MIVSHRYRYVFVELPRTGSTAVSKELQLYYDGHRILKKHSTYRDFLKQATPAEAKYFAFSGMRNPMDKLVSLYFKYKYDHRNYSDPHTFDSSNIFVTWLMQRQFRYVHEKGADFTAFFRHYYRVPYDDWSCLDHHRLNFILRFETLADDFAEVLRRIGIEARRPLPQVNKTLDRNSDFWSYFTPQIQTRARWVFGPYLKRWGYTFPDSWDQDVPIGSQIAFSIFSYPRRFYWLYLR